MLSKKYLIKL